MESLFDGIRWVHMIVGFTGLAAFWVPVITKKGGGVHKKAGRVFEWAAYLVAGSAVFNALGRLIFALLGGASLAGNEQPFGFLIFLAYLGTVTFASVRHGVRSTRTKDFSRMRTAPHMALAVGSIVGSVSVVAFALVVWTDLSIVLLSLSPLGFMQGKTMIEHMTRPVGERMTWFYSHLGNMIGAGIAFHTAFAVFGSGRIVGYELPGVWQLVPWVLPAAIGIPAHRILETKYREKFREPRPGRRTKAAAASA
jgi:hypothetical protein